MKLKIKDLVFGLDDEDDLESGFDGCPNCKTDGYLCDFNEDELKSIVAEKIKHINSLED